LDARKTAIGEQFPAGVARFLVTGHTYPDYINILSQNIKGIKQFVKKTAENQK
jgi:hypothetical protein